MRKNISSDGLYEELAGYSRAVVQGDWCFLAGTTGADPETGTFPQDAAAQARNAFRAAEAALANAGFAMTDVVRATYYATEADLFDQLAPIFGEAFRDVKPAATYLQVAGLARPEMLFEVEITAFRAA